jgi:hypothetical protein
MPHGRLGERSEQTASAAVAVEDGARLVTTPLIAIKMPMPELDQPTVSKPLFAQPYAGRPAVEKALIPSDSERHQSMELPG